MQDFKAKYNQEQDRLLSSWNDAYEVKDWLEGQGLLEFIGEFQNSAYSMCLAKKPLPKFEDCGNFPF